MSPTYFLIRFTRYTYIHTYAQYIYKHTTNTTTNLDKEQEIWIFTLRGSSVVLLDVMLFNINTLKYKPISIKKRNLNMHEYYYHVEEKKGAKKRNYAEPSNSNGNKNIFYNG